MRFRDSYASVGLRQKQATFLIRTALLVNFCIEGRALGFFLCHSWSCFRRYMASARLMVVLISPSNSGGISVTTSSNAALISVVGDSSRPLMASSSLRASTSWSLIFIRQQGAVIEPPKVKNSVLPIRRVINKIPFVKCLCMICCSFIDTPPGPTLGKYLYVKGK